MFFAGESATRYPATVAVKAEALSEACSLPVQTKGLAVEDNCGD
jgi:hypothetical protein